VVRVEGVGFVVHGDNEQQVAPAYALNQRPREYGAIHVIAVEFSEDGGATSAGFRG
jgi:hypothetical protein